MTLAEISQTKAQLQDSPVMPELNKAKTLPKCFGKRENLVCTNCNFYPCNAPALLLYMSQIVLP